jgi:hypothetical protein
MALNSSGWWHWPALIVAIISSGLLALVISAPAPERFQGLSQAEQDRKLQFCHDKGMTTAHATLDGGVTKIWCLMEVPHAPN